ncbi:hypothetical protein LMG29739_02085 [Paraburkholderia solisilvae]|uniref:Uncharacterized protein n=1 Tax=Paraburkholderia solisilvae TaxID=624376 RepID=A0A6J5DP79_9BURK|nr:hypothetical protein LMG29739_02085 [Paraburkholderia solisilvae]
MNAALQTPAALKTTGRGRPVAGERRLFYAKGVGVLQQRVKRARRGVGERRFAGSGGV